MSRIAVIGAGPMGLVCAYDLIKSGYNSLKVICMDKKVTCYINDVRVIDTNVYAYSSGRLGVFCCGEVEAVFDDFAVMK